MRRPRCSRVQQCCSRQNAKFGSYASAHLRPFPSLLPRHEGRHRRSACPHSRWAVLKSFWEWRNAWLAYQRSINMADFAPNPAPKKSCAGALFFLIFDHDIRALPPPLETSFAVVREWLDKITAASTNPDLDLRNLRAVLIHLLEIVEQDPTIDAAVDNLADAASAYLKEGR